MSGLIPITWQELQSYSQQSGVLLNGWESTQIIAMSREYVEMRALATEDKSLPAPYARELDEEEANEWRNSLSNRQVIGNMKVTKGKANGN